MSRMRLALAAVALGITLAACRGAETPQMMHWYGGSAVTTGVYDTPESYQGPYN